MLRAHLSDNSIPTKDFEMNGPMICYPYAVWYVSMYINIESVHEIGPKGSSFYVSPYNICMYLSMAYMGSVQASSFQDARYKLSQKI